MSSPTVFGATATIGVVQYVSVLRTITLLTPSTRTPIGEATTWLPSTLDA